MQNEASQTPAPTINNYEQTPDKALPTFLDHIHELRRRLFWVVAVVLIASTVAYSFLNDVIQLLTAPLGDKQLYYLTPAGGLTFTFKLCTFVGFVAGVPVAMYHIYRFVEPLMGSSRKSALFYVGLSTIFAGAGVAFAYFVSLPAALHFLTNFNLGNIQAMLTVDSYLSFVITYLLGAALLFQIPLILLIINTMTPLKPSKLMKLQKFVIVGAFIVGAIISPTPDVMNQSFLAIPIIAMYQLGVVLVWLRNTSAARKARRQAKTRSVMPEMPSSSLDTVPSDVLAELAQPQPVPLPVAPIEQPEEPLDPLPAPTPVAVVAEPVVAAQPKPRPRPQRRMMDIGPRTAPARAVARPLPPSARRPASPGARPTQPLSVPGRTIDGFMRPASAQTS
jgi:sec-independent protein translocase protein TatC